MIADGEVLDLIPARGGSNGVPRKNLRPIAGKPLLQWTAEATHASRYLDWAILSTDDEEIAQVGASLDLDAPVRRAPKVAADTASAADAVRHAVATLTEGFR